MEAQTEHVAGMETASAPEPKATPTVGPSSADVRARRLLVTGLVVAGLLLLGTVVLLVFLSLDAYRAARLGVAPSAAGVVVGLLRDAAIVFVAFETLIIGALLVVLVLQIQSLIVLLRAEIGPMLEAANETMGTVRGTTRFVSRSVVSPVLRWSGYVAGLQRIVRGITGIREGSEER